MNVGRFLFSEESGQGMLEYALLLVLLSIAAIMLVTIIGEKSKENFFIDINGVFDHHESPEWKLL